MLPGFSFASLMSSGSVLAGTEGFATNSCCSSTSIVTGMKSCCVS